MLLSSLLFVPVIAYLFNRTLRAMGTSTVLNNEIYQIGLSVNGILWILLIVCSCVVLLFIQFGVILIVSQQHIFAKKVYITDAFVTTIRSIPKLISLSFIQMILFFFFLIPFIH